MDYQKDVEEDAVDLLLNNKDTFKEAIKDGSKFNYNEISYLDSIIHDNITDRSYSPEDAVYILENCENEETDSGLWQGLNDWRQELAARAAYSYEHDVFFKTEEIYNELKEKYENIKGTYEHWINTVNSIELNEDIPTEDAIEKVRDGLIEDFENNGIPFDKDQFINALTTQEFPEDLLLDIVWEEFKLNNTIQPIDPDSQEALSLLKEWNELNEHAGMWGGFPLGSSYIDARCGTGHGMPNVKEFVSFDNEVARKLPNVAGKRKDAVLDEIKRLEGIHKCSGG